MLVINEYGYQKGKLIADWGCRTCQRIIYHATTEDALSNEERHGQFRGWCTDCVKAQAEAERRARHLWMLAQTERPPIPYKGGVFVIRDDLFQYLVGNVARPTRQLNRLFKKLELPLPRRFIPLHTPEF